jgi:hypothetical protein
LLAPFGIGAQKVIAPPLVNYTFSEIIIGCAGLILALTESRNNKKLSEFKTPVLLPKKLSFSYIKNINANSISKK